MSTRTSHAHKNLAGIILTGWLLTCFLFMHPHTVPRVVDLGKIALVTALVTATVSSRVETLGSPRTRCYHIADYNAPGSSEVSSTSSGVYSTQARVDVTVSTPVTFSAAGVLTSFTPIFVKRMSSNAGQF